MIAASSARSSSGVVPLRAGLVVLVERVRAGDRRALRDDAGLRGMDTATMPLVGGVGRGRHDRNLDRAAGAGTRNSRGETAEVRAVQARLDLQEAIHLHASDGAHAWPSGSCAMTLAVGRRRRSSARCAAAAASNSRIDLEERPGRRRPGSAAARRLAGRRGGIGGGAAGNGTVCDRRRKSKTASP